MWLYLELGHLRSNYGRWGHKWRFLIQYDWCPLNEKERHHSGHLRIKAMWGQSETAICNPRRQASGETRLVNNLILDLQSPELWEVNFSCLSHLVCSVLLWEPQWTDTVLKKNSPCGGNHNCIFNVNPTLPLGVISFRVSLSHPGQSKTSFARHMHER